MNPLFMIKNMNLKQLHYLKKDHFFNNSHVACSKPRSTLPFLSYQRHPHRTTAMILLHCTVYCLMLNIHATCCQNMLLQTAHVVHNRAQLTHSTEAALYTCSALKRCGRFFGTTSVGNPYRTITWHNED